MRSPCLIVFVCLGWSATAGATERKVEGSASPNGAYEFAITDIAENIQGNLVLRETKSRRVLASTNFKSPVAFRTLQEPFQVTPDRLCWDEKNRFVALNMHMERHLGQLLVFRVAGRSVRAVPIAHPDWLSPLGWISPTDLVCQSGDEDAVVLRFREQPLRSSVIANTRSANDYWEKLDGDASKPLGWRSPDGRYELSTRFDTAKRMLLRETKSGRNLFNKANLPAKYLGMDDIPGPRWSPDGQWVVFTIIIDYDRSELVGFHIEDSTARPVKISDPRGLTALGWVHGHDLICRNGGMDSAIILHFRQKPLSAVALTTTPTKPAPAEEDESGEAAK